jgi:hypothetical protein
VRLLGILAAVLGIALEAKPVAVDKDVRALELRVVAVGSVQLVLSAAMDKDVPALGTPAAVIASARLALSVAIMVQAAHLLVDPAVVQGVVQLERHVAMGRSLSSRSYSFQILLRLGCAPAGGSCCGSQGRSCTSGEKCCGR